MKQNPLNTMPNNEIDVCQNWANDAPLRSSAVGFIEFKIFSISCSHKLPHQSNELLVGSSLSQNFNECVVVNIVKEPLDVALYKPICSGKSFVNS